MLWSLFGCRPCLLFPYACGFGCGENVNTNKAMKSKRPVKLCKTKKKENWRSHQGQKTEKQTTEFAWYLPHSQHSATSTCVGEIEPLILHCICDIWKIDRFMLHGICRILQMICAAFLNFNPPILHAKFPFWFLEALCNLVNQLIYIMVFTPTQGNKKGHKRNNWRGAWGEGRSASRKERRTKLRLCSSFAVVVVLVSHGSCCFCCVCCSFYICCSCCLCCWCCSSCSCSCTSNKTEQQGSK